MEANKLNELKKEKLIRLKAKIDFKTFMRLKFERFERKEFHDNWHIDYLCKVLEHTLPTQERTPIKNLMVNMPPSYGKTEIIARNFIAWALGNHPERSFFYISYSDELCKKISMQVRTLLKSRFFTQIFGTPPKLKLDNSSEIVLEQGGGLFCTTFKASLTGFHADQILIDDPIKVSDMPSRAERLRVNQNFRESVLTRLKNRNANITILMQRLGDEDLCGFLLDPKYSDQSSIDEWNIVTLKALEKEDKTYKIGDYCYKRKANEPLFPFKHTREELENLRLKMGNDEFSTQFLQEPQVSEAGFFESVYFKNIPSFELGEHNSYIFVDNATSLNTSADNRAIVLIGVEMHKENVRYVVKDCVYGIWSEEETITNLIDVMSNNPSAQVFIESEGGGLTLVRLLEQALSKVNTELKNNNKAMITNSYQNYSASRKIAKVEKIKALRPYYNTGQLVFLHNARGLDQIKKELFSFNPEKPFRKDDCIDCIASALAHPQVLPKYKQKQTYTSSTQYYQRMGNFRI
ncbi:terminase large subunit domain-containing protein [Helicobacter equorum]|uniref:terminase large subunit domain-containing protein n=1 Tax=Helicobacter equorum TaxID=361872 RepID=UPI000CF1580E|nr:terminase family protein [Helicobacter equorum]